jgi:2-polyprenyl-3-methyl-5-hydroxy-6-metoxy-1,4-benzoquinol methylase
MPQKDLHQANRLSWNEATKAHNSHKGDQAAFFRSGGTTLFPEEVELLGDVRGQSVIHLQCNAGQDTLSIARLDATVTGVDISDEAIDFARKLAADSGIPATFIRSDIYDWFATADQQFDVVFTSYGALVWLSDIRAWAAGVHKLLKPGGRLVLIEFHPFMCILDEHTLMPRYDYMYGKTEFVADGVGDYVAYSNESLSLGAEPGLGVQDFQNPHPVYEFAWGIGDVISALLAAGLNLKHFHEYPYSNGFVPFAHAREKPGRRKYPPEGVPNIPMMYSVVATKPET